MEILPQAPIYPPVWVVSTDKTGHINQCLALLKLLAWPCDRIIRIPSPVAADPLLLRLGKALKRQNLYQQVKDAPLRRPQLIIIASGTASEAVVAHYRQRLGKNLFSVYIGSPKSKKLIFDIAVASHHEVAGVMPHYPAAQKTIWISGVFAAGISHKPRLAARLLEVILIGGANKSFSLPSALILQQIHLILALKPRTEHEIAIIFSRRTPLSLEDSLRIGLQNSGVRFVGRDDRLGYIEAISGADEFYITPDSITMICEACATGMAVSLFDVPCKDRTTSAARFVREAVLNGRVCLLGQSHPLSHHWADDGISTAVHSVAKAQALWAAHYFNMESNSLKRVWLLSAGRIGDLKQMQALASALDCNFEIKNISFRAFPFKLFPFFSPYILTAAAKKALREEMPDMIISAESRASAVAVRLKKKHRMLRLVCLTRPRGAFRQFDIIITTPQFGLPPAENILEINLPLTQPEIHPHIPTHKISDQKQIALLVGGASAPHKLDVAVMAKLCDDVLAYVKAQNAALYCTTSARSGTEVEQVITEKFGNLENIFLWSQGSEGNPYHKILAQSDAFIVTADSVSMVADAIATGKPVYVYDLPLRWTWWRFKVQKMWVKATEAPLSYWGYFFRFFFNCGLLESRANRAALYKKLEDQGALTMFGNVFKGSPQTHLYTHDIEASVNRIKRL